jgi:hypothetical protein
MDYERLYSVISLAGIIICVMNIQKAILVGVAWLALFSGGALVSGIVQAPLEWTNRIHQIGLFLLILFYLFCIVKNKQYIQDGWMPDSWYLYSYFILAFTTASVMTTMRYNTTKDSDWLAMTYLLETCLFVFVLIQYIICTFFRTDGFRI